MVTAAGVERIAGRGRWSKSRFFSAWRRVSRNETRKEKAATPLRMTLLIWVPGGESGGCSDRMTTDNKVGPPTLRNQWIRRRELSGLSGRGRQSKSRFFAAWRR